MNSFQSSLKGVFGGWGVADVLSPQRHQGPWPLFKLVPSVRPERPPRESLAKVIEREVIPRLVVANRPSSKAPAPTCQDVKPIPTLDAEAVEAFTWSVLSRTPNRMNAYIRELLQNGAWEEQIYDKLIAPAARFLIDLWGEDKISYIEVTVSLNRLQQLIQDFDFLTPYGGENQSCPRSALFAPSPGGQQTFGFYVMEELFRWSGWRAWVETETNDKDLGATARCHWFDVACLNVTRETDIKTVAVTIDVLRRMSRNRDLRVLVYGRPCMERPWLIETVGADAAASSANEALNIMDEAMACPTID